MVTNLQFIPPKTDWTSDDRFNIDDYNRIRGNILYLHEYANHLVRWFEISDMGSEINSYRGYWSASRFNIFEENIEVLNRNVKNKNYGARQTFYDNGLFIGFEELNRIEGAILDMKEELDKINAGLRRIPFRLGTFKQLRI